MPFIFQQNVPRGANTATVINPINACKYIMELLIRKFLIRFKQNLQYLIEMRLETSFKIFFKLHLCSFKNFAVAPPTPTLSQCRTVFSIVTYKWHTFCSYFILWIHFVAICLLKVLLKNQWKGQNFKFICLTWRYLKRCGKQFPNNALKRNKKNLRNVSKKDKTNNSVAVFCFVLCVHGFYFVFWIFIFLFKF